MRQFFLQGFLKRANSSLNKRALLKTARDPMLPLVGLGSLGINALIHLAAQGGGKAENKSDRIDKQELAAWARKYLKTKNVEVVPIKNLNNAAYVPHMRDGEQYHGIVYDPTMNKSVGAHEIGHGMGKIPRVPFSDKLAPLLIGYGAYRAGHNNFDAHEAGLLPLLAGAAIQLPTVADEWLASHNARKILKENNIEPKGLNRAWLTYLAPLITGGLAAGVGYATRNNHY
jgi:hypothetical protein